MLLISIYKESLNPWKNFHDLLLKQMLNIIRSIENSSLDQEVKHLSLFAKHKELLICLIKFWTLMLYNLVKRSTYFLWFLLWSHKFWNQRETAESNTPELVSAYVFKRRDLVLCAEFFNVSSANMTTIYFCNKCCKFEY